MQGLNMTSIKKHPALIPLYVCFGAGLIGSVGYTIRLATRNPDVTWNSKKKPEPWQEFKDKQYRLYATPELAELKSPAPEYK